MIWSPALADIFGVKPWELWDTTPRELERMRMYLDKMAEEPTLGPGG